MKNVNRYFTIFVITTLILLGIGLYLLPDLPNMPAWIYAVELTGTLSEGFADIGDAYEYTAAGSDGNYQRLKSWGLLRGKNGELPKADPGAPELLAKYNSIYIGDTSQKKIYLTFDEGYENGYTPKILDVLYENKVNAIFFITGPYLEKEDALVRRMIDEGHAVGNHTIRHKSLPLLSDSEVEEETAGLDRRFYDRYGKNMIFLRPPKGEYSERTLSITSKLGYVNVFWSFAYDDWAADRHRGWEYAFEKVKNNLHNGMIILLHAVSRDNAEALDKIIEYARQEGYEFGDVFELERFARGEGL